MTRVPLPREKTYGYMPCRCCGRRQRIYAGEVWDRPLGDASVRIIEPCRDGAIVEQIGRPQDGRFGLSYDDLRKMFVRRPVNPQEDER